MPMGVQPRVAAHPLPAGAPPRARSPPRAAAAASGAAASAGPSVLVADIGGTNARFQLWRLEPATLRPAALAAEAFLPTADFPRFDAALAAFLAEPAAAAAPPSAAAFACAGPVRAGRCEFTNLGWTVDAAEVGARFGLPAAVLNDFEAQGYGVPLLGTAAAVAAAADGPDAALKASEAAGLLQLNPGAAPEPRGPIAVLGPGTGLGEAQLFWDARAAAYAVHASEGSHATFAPRGAAQRALQAAVEAALGHCEVEHVASGPGLARIYAHLAAAPGSGATLGAGATPAAVSAAALAGADPAAAAALDMLLEIVGAEAGHMALRGLATGGVYLCGGILPKVLPRLLAGGGLAAAFAWRESRFSPFLARVPLFLVTEQRLGLLGARARAVAALEAARAGAVADLAAAT